MSRINLQPPIPTTDTTTDRIQKRLSDAVNSILARPATDHQLVTVPLQNTSTAQTVTFSHSLGRPLVAATIVHSTVPVSAVGAQKANGTTGGSLSLTTSSPVAGATATLMVF